MKRMGKEMGEDMGRMWTDGQMRRWKRRGLSNQKDDLED
jgi:hypothetical protein